MAVAKQPASPNISQLLFGFMREEERQDLGTDQTVPLDVTRGATRVSGSRPADGRTFARSFIGRRLGDYEILREIGHGSMGIVFEAKNEGLNRSVALKVLPPSLSVTDTVIQRFLREAQSVAKLNHENIVQIYSIGETDGVYFYAMQLIEGQPLDAVVAERDIKPDDAARITAACARALFFAHENGIIHRDIKPANIILSYKDKPVLTDFGLARPEKAATLTASGALVGTPIYMSPEQVRADRSLVDRRTDIYSLGVTLYEMLAGTTPFEGSSTQEILHKIEFAEPRPIRRVAPKVPKSLETICHKAIAREPERRYQTGIEFALDLERFLNGEPIQARRTPLVVRTAQRIRRHAVISTLVALLLVAVVAVLISSKRGHDSKQREQTANQTATRAQFAEYIVRGTNMVRGKVWPEAIAAFDQAILLDPTQVAPFIERGKCFVMLQSHERALADFEAALERDPENGTAKLWRGMSRWIYGNEEERNAGMNDVRETLDQHPDDPDCLLFASRLCREMAQETRSRELKITLHDAAYERVSQLLDQNPENVDALVIKGMLLEDQGFREQALRAYTRAIEIDPKHAEAWSLRSAVLTRDNPRASRATTDATDAAMAAVAPAWATLGVRIAREKFNVDGDTVARAVDALTSWRDPGEDPGDAPASSDEPGVTDVDDQLAQAELWWTNGQYDLAVPTYEEILKLKPDLALPHYRLAKHYMLINRVDKARAHVDEARRIAPATPDTLLIAIQVYSRQEDKEKLAEVADAIQRYYPDFVDTVPWLREMLERFKSSRAASPDEGAPPEDPPVDGGAIDRSASNVRLRLPGS